MSTATIKKVLAPLTGIFEKITDPEIRAAVGVLLSLVEELAKENESLKNTVQELKDEINRLKGEQGKPKIRPQKNKDKDEHSSEKERAARKKKQKKKQRKQKKATIKAQRSVICKIDPASLPSDAQRKGYKPIIIQDVKLGTDNIEFQREVYYSRLLKKTFIADLPKGYSGEFGPSIKSLVISLYHECNMTEPALERFLNACGIVISKASISRILTDNHDIFHEEKEAIIDAGLKGPYQQTDDTSARVNGKNHHVHILCNPFYTAYFTRPKKDRMTLLEILCRSKLKFLFNDEAFQLMEVMRLPEKRISQLKAMQIEGAMTRIEVDAVLLTLFTNPKTHKTNRRIILESAALSHYHRLPDAVKHLMCDDAPQFNQIAQHQSLCWIHEGRHYKKLNPIVPLHRKQLNEFLDAFWDFYQKLLDYTEQAKETDAKQLQKDFDTLFSKKTGYQQLDQRIALTFTKKQALLLPLTFPFLPLHNNEAENGAQHQARLRDIHLQTKNEKGTQAKDTFATIVKTARKLKVNLIDYFHDRLSGAFTMPSLAELILEKCQPPPNTC